MLSDTIKKFIKQALLGLLVLFIALFFVFNLNFFQGSISRSLSKDTGFNITMDEIDFVLYQPNKLTIKGLHVQHKKNKNQRLNIGSIQVNFSFWDMLFREANIENLQIQKVEVNWDTSTDPKESSKEKSPKTNESESRNSGLKALHLANTNIAPVNLVIKSPNGYIEAVNFQLEGKQIDLIQDGRFSLEKVFAELQLSLEKLDTPQLKATNTEAGIRVAAGKVILEPLKSSIFNGLVEVSGEIDLLKGNSVHLQKVLLQNLQLDTNQFQKNQEKPNNKSTEQTESSQLPIAALSIGQCNGQNITVKAGSPEQPIQLNALQWQTENIQVIKNHQLLVGDKAADFQIKGHMEWSDGTIGALTMQQGAFDFQAHLGQVVLKNMSFEAGNSKLAGAGSIDLNAPEIPLTLHISQSQFDLAEIIPKFSNSDHITQGILQVKGEIFTPLIVNDPNDYIGLSAVDLGIHGEDWKLNHIDLNNIIQGYQESQQTSLLDVGGFLLTGPVGIIASQFVELGKGALTAGGTTELKQLSSKIHMKDGSATLNQTAFSTDKYRMALQGGLNIKAQEFAGFSVHLLNPKGCSVLEQRLSGPFTAPASAITDTLIGTVLNPLAEIGDTLTGLVKDCEPIYQGEVTHPKQG
ncbi:AsmA family protein [Algicola sagamiensis]|uniref:hypothetical protein n=1 Tax=Algicola sagamiensis TaxID=163869 RepID=UPI00037AE06D|nr:hypothetical protein [Algicola sagamiensis]